MATERTPRRLRVTHWIAVAVPVLAMAVWSFEMTREYAVNEGLQASVDAAALAAAENLGDTDRVQQAAQAAAKRDAILEEYVQLKARDIEVGYVLDGVFQPALHEPGIANAVRVSHTHRYEMLFGPVFGFEPIRVTRSSIAVGVARTASARPEPATPVMTTQDTSGW